MRLTWSHWSDLLTCTLVMNWVLYGDWVSVGSHEMLDMTELVNGPWGFDAES